MIRDISALENQTFDVVVIGAGISGAFLAHDAALRGLKVAVIDKSDFGSATSSASSKLLHGGIRYLQEGRLNKVRESAMERVFFQTIAPHLTRYIPFVVPAEKGITKGLFLLIAGMIAYRITCFGQNRFIKDKAKKVPGWKLLSAADVQERIPDYDHSGKGGVEFFESHMHSSERMTLAVLQTAASNGASVANYVRFSEFLLDDDSVIGIRANDECSNRTIEIKCSYVINAAGPWIPSIDSALSGCSATRSGFLTGYSVGAHVITESLTRNCAVALSTKSRNQSLVNRGGRHVFVIPWRESSLIGTSYRSYSGALDDVRPSETDINYLIESVNSAFGKEVLRRRDIKHTYAGVYPLIDVIDEGTYQGTGDYKIVDHQENGIKGVLTVFGAKYTTARLLAERALNHLEGRIGKPMGKCATHVSPTVYGDISDIQLYRETSHRLYSTYLPTEIIDNLINCYGLAIENIMNIAIANNEMLQKVSEHRDVIKAEVVYAARNEMIVSLEDFVFRRTGLGTLGFPGSEALDICASLLGEELNWDKSRQQLEKERVQRLFVLTTNPQLPEGGD